MYVLPEYRIVIANACCSYWLKQYRIPLWTRRGPDGIRCLASHYPLLLMALQNLFNGERYKRPIEQLPQTGDVRQLRFGINPLGIGLMPNRFRIHPRCGTRSIPFTSDLE
ncbi:hypothetical protein MPH_01337 [Macrophomina phaseolina MS6]|uniref:Uncharacterized protein n=1 Tax=Macrophomina phaseolina (strain MS6) TaxID=1126212 RepID=K2SXQ4_MACPH|nr:hypothetical protein MPH_01337 [Macrophomina phaseolina MS6]